MSEPRRSGTLDTGMPASAAIGSAASAVKPPTNTPRRSQRARSCSPSRSTLQAMAARMVCNRAGASRGPPVSSSSLCSSRAAGASGERTLFRAAASSIARGRPSSRLQMPMTAFTLRSVSWNVGWTARARSTNSFTALDCAASSTGRWSFDVVTARDSTGTMCSPDSERRTRLVATTVRDGHACSRALISERSSRRCSRLSRIRTSDRDRSALRSICTAGSAPVVSMPRTCATARRVFPIPPGQVSEMSRTFGPRTSETTERIASSLPNRGWCELAHRAGQAAPGDSRSGWGCPGPRRWRRVPRSWSLPIQVELARPGSSRLNYRFGAARCGREVNPGVRR